MKNIVRRIRTRLYKLGFRPKYGSIWYSPSLAYVYGVNDLRKINENR
jgi:hypothetical protein